MAKRKQQKASAARKRKVNRELVIQALTDRRFRTLLETRPSKILGKRPTAAQQREIALVLAAVKGIERQIHNLADELLCVNGPCGIASA